MFTCRRRCSTDVTDVASLGASTFVTIGRLSTLGPFFPDQGAEKSGKVWAQVRRTAPSRDLSESGQKLVTVATTRSSPPPFKVSFSSLTFVFGLESLQTTKQWKLEEEKVGLKPSDHKSEVKSYNHSFIIHILISGFLQTHFDSVFFWIIDEQLRPFRCRSFHVSGLVLAWRRVFDVSH